MFKCALQLLLGDLFDLTVLNDDQFEHILDDVKEWWDELDALPEL